MMFVGQLANNVVHVIASQCGQNRIVQVALHLGQLDTLTLAWHDRRCERVERRLAVPARAWSTPSISLSKHVQISYTIRRTHFHKTR